MKPILFLIVCVVLVYSSHAQDIIFSMNQTGIAQKNAATKQFDEAEVKNSDVLITLQDKKVTLYDDNDAAITISLEKMNGQNNNINHLYSQTWKAQDSRKNPVQFKFTVNVDNKEAIVEVVYKDYKSYYFGKFNYGSLTDGGNKLAEASPGIRN